jgi:hypothetical protein
MKQGKFWIHKCAFLIGLAAMVLTTSPLTAQEKFKETYQAFAVAMGTSFPPVIPPGVSTTVQLNITRWTTGEERESLFAALIENGQEGLVNALRKQKETGFVRVIGRGAGLSTFPSERLRYAWQWDLGDGNRRIVLALDRPISFYEAVDRPRWRDYDVSLIVMDVNAEGRGQGQLAMGVRLSIDQENKKLVVESFGTEPVRLNNVRKR